MSIVKKRKTEEDFIGGAPDATAKPKGVMKGRKRQISLTLAPELLERVDEMARSLGVSRAAYITLAIRQAVERGVEIEGRYLGAVQGRSATPRPDIA